MKPRCNLWHGRILFHCPGCDSKHQAIVDGSRGWVWNNSIERPTLSPSVLVNATEMTSRGRADFEAWHAAGCPPRDGKAFETVPTICHSFVTDGKIQFLSDCTHALAGQTVELPDWEE